MKICPEPEDMGVPCSDGSILYPTGATVIIAVRDNLPTEEKVFPYDILIFPEQKLLHAIDQEDILNPAQESTFIIINAGSGQPLILQLAGTKQLPWCHRKNFLEKN